MADSAGATATPSTNAPQAQQSTPAPTPTPPPDMDQARKALQEPEKAKAPVDAKPKSEPKPKADKEPEDAKPKKSAESDDDSADVFGEKLTRAELKELRDIREKRREFDRAAHTKMQQAAEMRKGVEAEKAEFLKLANALRENPFALHEKLGLNADEIAEARLVQQMKRAQMTPEQIELANLKAENEKLKSDNKQRDEDTNKTKSQELRENYKKHYDQLIGEAMTKANLARTRGTAAKVAGVMAEYKEAGEDIDPVLAAQIVRDTQQTEISHELTELAKTNPRAAIALLPPELVTEIRKQAADKAREFVPQAQPKRETQTIQPPANKKAPPTLEDARKSLGISRY